MESSKDQWHGNYRYSRTTYVLYDGPLFFMPPFSSSGTQEVQPTSVIGNHHWCQYLRPEMNLFFSIDLEVGLEPDTLWRRKATFQINWYHKKLHYLELSIDLMVVRQDTLQIIDWHYQQNQQISDTSNRNPRIIHQIEARSGQAALQSRIYVQTVMAFDSATLIAPGWNPR